MSDKPMTPKERREQLVRDMYNAIAEPYMTKEERLHSLEIWLHMFEDTVTSDLILQTQIDELNTQLSTYEEVREAGEKWRALHIKVDEFMTDQNKASEDEFDLLMDETMAAAKKLRDALSKLPEVKDE